MELPQKTLVGDNGIVEKVLDDVVRYFEVERDQLLQRKRRLPQRARDVCMYLLKEHSGLDNKRIGEVFGVSLSAVTKAALRVSEQMKTQRKLKQEPISFYILFSQAVRECGVLVFFIKPEKKGPIWLRNRSSMI